MDQSTLDEMKQVRKSSLTVCTFCSIVIAATPSISLCFPVSSSAFSPTLLAAFSIISLHFGRCDVAAWVEVDGRPKAGAGRFRCSGAPSVFGSLLYPCAAHSPAKPSPFLPNKA